MPSSSLAWRSTGRFVDASAAPSSPAASSWTFTPPPHSLVCCPVVKVILIVLCKIYTAANESQHLAFPWIVSGVAVLFPANPSSRAAGHNTATLLIRGVTDSESHRPVPRRDWKISFK
ncbi:hypothetical protein BV898_17191 [Hypsibius exemplaris]|uniref:Uncharacterized protein n=1 Tax=Hypsibius exemplaris TaxID=2072580 RepID=A0A9X6NH91_HYPEX|nr:hypothetical protein BV898_17191 [Hypsibius exemplaris]